MDHCAILADFRANGFARVGRVADDAMLEKLRARADAIMLGEVTYDGLFFQKDSPTHDYDDLEYGKGWEGPSLEYRKVEKLEMDPLFLAWIDHPLFSRLARAVIGEEDLAIYRAFLMNKSATGGSNLPWHQDGGNFWGLDRDPQMQIWTALDDAPLDGGCVEFVPGTHAAGLATPLGGVVPAEIVARRLGRADPSEIVAVPAKAGDVLLIHNHVWHRSGVNHSGHPRRALSVCYMSAATRCIRKKRAPRTFFRVFVPR